MNQNGTTLQMVRGLIFKIAPLIVLKFFWSLAVAAEVVVGIPEEGVPEGCYIQQAKQLIRLQHIP